MLFNSIDFALFLPIVFTLYWLLRDQLRLQNLLIVIASFLFYGWWDYRFLSLLLFSSLVDYTIGLALDKEANQRKRKWLLAISLVLNLGLLATFKYYNFFIDNFIAAFSLMGYELQYDSLKIVLPVGISFYTFQTLSYGIDVYRKKMKPTKDLISFLAFVSFFPQLVAGPIERASQLLPQFHVVKKFDYAKAVDGLRQILWGLYKKVVVADTCASYVNIVFANPMDHNGSSLCIGAVFFAFQIYGDFSGYSDIAIGTARLFNIDLMQNFSFPYFSRDIAEFWRRWHISLSTWFRDYVYIPLGGSTGSIGNKVRNTFIVFIVSGFWHGANWTFVVWGLVNALYFLPLLLQSKNRINMEIVAQNRKFPTMRELVSMVSTFLLVVLAWVIFRADCLSDVGIIFSKIASFSVAEKLYIGNKNVFLLSVAGIISMILIEWNARRLKFGLQEMGLNWPRPVRWLTYCLIILLIMFCAETEQEFIYFQF